MELPGRHWLGAPRAEIILILLPPLLSVLVVLLFQSYFSSHTVSTFWWVLVVLGIDVSHVYSTLFRLYWDKQTFQDNRKLLVIIPVVTLLAGIIVYQYNHLIFWRCLAYLAVFHFVRQQYGFMRLYTRKEMVTAASKWINSLAIYSATIYPLLYWHLNATSKISWFVEGDFIAIHNTALNTIAESIYWGILVVYIIHEGWRSNQSREFNLPKNLVVAGTYLSWYVGIVAFQADLIFTLVNVVSHGIPYMALIWIHGNKKPGVDFSFSLKGLAIFSGVLIILAYVEEFFWDVFIWNDHPELFPAFDLFSPVENPWLISVLVPLLVLPQVTHYVLDGFIWRFSKEKKA